MFSFFEVFSVAAGMLFGHADHSQLYSLYNTKLRHQIQFLRVRCHQGLSMKREKRFHASC